MPNWCENVVTITGNLDNLTRFKNTMNTPDEEGKVVEFSFYQTIPRPKIEDKYWYNWNWENWGCKWDVGDSEIKWGENEVTICFETPWDPPGPWAKTVARLFDLKIVIEFEDPGWPFTGEIVATASDFTWKRENGRRKREEEKEEEEESE
jgi:hypothetical protein